MPSKSLCSAKPYVFLSAIAAYLLSALYPAEPLHWVVSLLSMLILIVVFRSVPPFVQGLSALFLLVGASLPAQLLKMKEQFIVFLSAGFMISAIQTSGAGDVINAWIMAGKNAIGTDLFLLLIPLIPFGLAFVGCTRLSGWL